MGLSDTGAVLQPTELSSQLRAELITPHLWTPFHPVDREQN